MIKICSKGLHALDAENLSIRANGKKSCRACKKDYDKNYWDNRSKILKENRKRDGIGRYNRLKTHCKNGHEFTEENTLVERTSKKSPNPSRRCIECLNISQPISNRKSRLKKLYGLSLEDYENINKKQNGLCAICQRPQASICSKGNLDVDHDHKTNKVRGLLCNPCNFGLGVFEDNIERMRNAIKYLEERNNN